MRKKKQGFTLIELLIAATIIGILAVFATTAYRNSAADTRVAAAKAKLEALAAAVQRYKLDPAMCPAITSTSTLTVANLVNCGFLEKGLFSLEIDDYFTFQVCGGVSGTQVCPSSTYLACMAGKSAKLPNRYLQAKGYSYCMDQMGRPVESLGAE